MASQTRPFLMTGAALASAAAVVAATPIIAPGITTAQVAVSQAGVNLATFADVLTIPADEWVAAFFQGYGGIVGPNNPNPADPTQKGGLEPWASQCNATCFIAGPSGPVYLGLDALLGGNGNGWDDREFWQVGAVNYYFEGGSLGAGTEWLLQQSIGAANPVLAVALTLLFTGAELTTVVFDNAIQLLGDAALGLPLVGQYVAGALNAYLGAASLYPEFQGYTQGLSGVLNYGIDVVLGTAPVIPTAPAAVLAAASAAAVATPATNAVEAVSAAPAAPAAVTAPAEVAAPTAADVVESATVGASDKSEAAGTEAAETKATGGTESTEAPESTEGPSTTDGPSAADVKPSAGSAADTASTSASKPAATGDNAATPRKRPLRDAVEKVTAGIGSALKGTKASATADSVG